MREEDEMMRGLDAGGVSLLSSVFRIMICARISKTGGAFSPIKVRHNRGGPLNSPSNASDGVQPDVRATGTTRRIAATKQTVLRKRDQRDSDDRSKEVNRISYN
jgi:hypothetical protein